MLNHFNGREKITPTKSATPLPLRRLRWAAIAASPRDAEPGLTVIESKPAAR
jgi:hypothetical protein